MPILSGSGARLIPDALSPVWPPVSYPVDERYGRVSIEAAEPPVAASLGTWVLTYTAGKYGVDDGGGLRILLPNNTDFGVPQFTHPDEPNYCRVACSTPVPCHVEAHFSHDLGVRPVKKGLQLIIRDAAMLPGDTITVAFGDRTGGSPGAVMQSFVGRLRFYVLLDAQATGVYRPVGAPAVLYVHAGPPDHLRAHAPSDVVVGEPFALTVVVRDRWGNVVSRRTETRLLATAGVHALPVEEAGLRGESNPIRCQPAGEAAGHRVYWGDLHAQTEETGGTGTLDEYFAYARECAALDFAGHQANDFQVSAAVWERICAETAAHDAANRFTTFAGYEWSGNTPAGGDHNVHFRGGDKQTWTLHRSSHWQVPDDSDETTDRYPVTELYRTFAGRDDVLLIPHVGGRYANVRKYFDESLMPLVEIASCWGVFEWLYADALERGMLLGFSAGSDDHTGRPGMSFAAPSQFATAGGLTAVLATERSRTALWEGLRARRTYATTGPRILLDVAAITPDARHPMGTLLDVGRDGVELSVAVHGTAPLWRVELLRWPEVIYRHPLPPPALAAGKHRLRFGWTGARIRSRRRLTRWDGRLTLTAGRLLSATGWGFDRPDHGIVDQADRAIAWRSDTAGDWDGVLVEIEGPADAPLRFESGPATFDVTPAQVEHAPLVVDGGGVGQRVEVERDPGPDQPRGVAFTFRDAAPPAGRHPYFVRVTQQDGHMAWSSPIFATVRDA